MSQNQRTKTEIIQGDPALIDGDNLIQLLHHYNHVEIAEMANKAHGKEVLRLQTLRSRFHKSKALVAERDGRTATDIQEEVDQAQGANGAHERRKQGAEVKKRAERQRKNAGGDSETGKTGKAGGDSDSEAVAGDGEAVADGEGGLPKRKAAAGRVTRASARAIAGENEALAVDQAETRTDSVLKDGASEVDEETRKAWNGLRNLADVRRQDQQAAATFAAFRNLYGQGQGRRQ